MSIQRVTLLIIPKFPNTQLMTSSKPKPSSHHDLEPRPHIKLLALIDPYFGSLKRAHFYVTKCLDTWMCIVMGL